MLETYKTAVETILKDIPERFTGINIDFYSIVPDHLHLIFTLNNANAPLGEVVRTFKALVTKSTGCKPFWEWSYYEHIIRDEKALYNIRKYILENPLKEKIGWDKIYSGINAAATNISTDNPQYRGAAVTLRSANKNAVPELCSGAIHRANSGVTLIIVVFAMMLLGVLGWTLARMQATNFESNLRTFEPENALNLAEAGAQWALSRLAADSTCRSQGGLLRCPPLASPVIDTDCNDNGDWMSSPHSLSPGQYNICVRNPCATCVPAESGDAVIVARGYIPTQAAPRVMRQIKLEVELGSLSNVLQTQVPDPDNNAYGLFDWTSARAGHTVQMEGNIEAGHYESDGDGVPDELPPGNPGYDYDSQPAPIMPDDISNPENERRDITSNYPSIDLVSFYNNPAYTRWPPPARTISIETPVRDTSSGTDLRVTTPNFFSQGFSFPDFTEQLVLHNITDDADGDWDNANWAVITNYINGTRVTLDRDVGESWDNDTIRLVLRFYDQGGGTDYTTLIYAGRQADGPGNETADILIDLNDDDVRFVNSSLISEGDIIIKGAGNNELRMSYAGAGTIYPMLATQAGDILSLDTPGIGSETTIMNRRRIAGLIYSEFGRIQFNYLRYPTSGPVSRQNNLLYGQQITLDGRIQLRYNSAVTPSGGFIFEPVTLTWKEE